ncbi:MAG: hypothetical protein K9M17_05005 [Mariprofundaceae bacterium]|nr:hypothetical protein [Mariprofundaceae bacterium]
MLSTDGSNILIVDDDTVNRHLFSVLLGEEGYLVEEAGSGEEALASTAVPPMNKKEA